MCRCCKQLSLSALFAKFCIREIYMSELNVSCSQDLRDQVLTVEPTNKMPALICRCLQALAEALKINKCVMNFISYDNQIGAEGAKAWCLVGSAECRGMS